MNLWSACQRIDETLIRKRSTETESVVHQENAASLAARVKKTDAREIESYYKQYYEKYVMALDQGEKADR